MNAWSEAAPTDAFRAVSVIDVQALCETLERSGGGERIAHTSAALEVRVEVFVSPGPGEMRVEDRDVLYVVLDGNGVLGLEFEDALPLVQGEATVVPAKTRHIVFGNPRISLLIVSAPAWSFPVGPLALCRRP
jgi:mannose-6-phosphate isomerase-like protein (cupin superfamily)